MRVASQSFIPPAEPDDLSAVSMADLRWMRSRLEEAENGYSYARRLVQGRLDTLDAERLRRRHTSESEDPTGDGLPDVLAAHGRSPGSPRPTRCLEPPEWADRLLDRLEEAVPPTALADLDAVDDESLAAMSVAASAIEAELSASRAGMHVRIDRLHDELVDRYRNGADAQDLLTP